MSRRGFTRNLKLISGAKEVGRTSSPVMRQHYQRSHVLDDDRGLPRPDFRLAVGWQGLCVVNWTEIKCTFSLRQLESMHGCDLGRILAPPSASTVLRCGEKCYWAFPHDYRVGRPGWVQECNLDS